MTSLQRAAACRNPDEPDAPADRPMPLALSLYRARMRARLREDAAPAAGVAPTAERAQAVLGLLVGLVAHVPPERKCPEWYDGYDLVRRFLRDCGEALPAEEDARADADRAAVAALAGSYPGRASA